MRAVEQFSVADVLVTALFICARNLGTFLPFSLIAFVPYFVVTATTEPVTDPLPFGDDAGRFWMLVIVGLVCECWQQAGLTYNTVRGLRGGVPGMRATLVESIRFAPLVLLVTAVGGIAVFFGLLLIVPGIILLLMFCVAAPTAVIERKYALAALGRSSELTAGYKGQIFGLMVILFALDWLVVLVAKAADLHVLVGELIIMVVAGFGAVVIAVVYHDLRMLKDGTDADQRRQLVQ